MSDSPFFCGLFSWPLSTTREYPFSAAIFLNSPVVAVLFFFTGRPAPPLPLLLMVFPFASWRGGVEIERPWNSCPLNLPVPPRIAIEFAGISFARLVRSVRDTPSQATGALPVFRMHRPVIATVICRNRFSVPPRYSEKRTTKARKPSPQGPPFSVLTTIQNPPKATKATASVSGLLFEFLSLLNVGSWVSLPPVLAVWLFRVLSTPGPVFSRPPGGFFRFGFFWAGS